MAISMHSASVPIFVRMLGNLTTWLDKAESHAAARKFDTSVYLNARLAPDMLPFTNQIQIACDAVKFGIARLSGVEAPKFADDEASLADLRTRGRKTIDFIQSVPAAQPLAAQLLVAAGCIGPRKSALPSSTPVWRSSAYAVVTWKKKFGSTNVFR